MSPGDVLSNRFVMLGSGVIFLSVLAVLALVILLGGGDSQSAVTNTTTGTPTVAPSPTPTPTAPASPPAVEATPVALPDGLQYIVVRAGAGTPVKSGDTITVNYSGWLQDTGALFDSTYSGKQPYTFTVGAGTVIKGWDEGVVGMQPGERRRLIIPPDLAYGATGHDNPTIPPNATLVVDIDLAGTGTPTPTPGPTPPASPPEVTGTPTTLADGLQYIVVTPGTGDAAKNGDVLSVNYSGWLKDAGTLFDSSLKTGRTPFSVTLGTGGVIKGWDEGLVGMQAGETRRLIIPAALAYGASGSGPVPPNADLIFDITLLSINAASATP